MRFAPFAALAAMASAVFVMASPVPVPAAVEVRVPEAVTVRSTARCVHPSSLCLTPF